ncbi:MAG: hypothetical protein ACOYJZ_03715 [Acutalibacter sp.]
MRKLPLRTLLFLTLCCDLGLFAKRIIGPVANIFTDALHIPGGIGTSFSLMFLTIAAAVVPTFGCGTIMGAVQSVLAMAFGMVGSMGALSPIGYILPGVAIDLLTWALRRTRLSNPGKLAVINSCAGVVASLAACAIVFRLRGPVLLLYLCVSATSGALCGTLGAQVVQRVKPLFPAVSQREVVSKSKDRE